jgi:deaminated glutathione amidase
VRAAAAAGAKLIVLPEKWTVLDDDPQTLAGAEPLDGPAMTKCSDLADELSVDLVAGSFAERLDSEGRVANTSIHFGPDGQMRATYRKIHLFDADVGGRVYRESDIFDAGNQPVLSELADGTVIGMAICFDLRFPELFTNLAAAGAEVFTVTAAFTQATTDAHWEPVVRSRAIENGCHVVAANQHGFDGAGRPSGGRSMIVSPWGAILDEAGPGAGMALAQIDSAARSEAAEAMPLRRLKRNQASSKPVKGLS